MNRLLALTTALDRTMANHVPDWANRNDADPGVTLLEVMAFLAEQLQYYEPIGERGAAAASRIENALEAYDHREPIAVSVDGERWERVRSLGDARAEAGVFIFENGAIAFGDGLHGRVPPDGSTVSARYRDGGGNTSVAIRTAWPLSDRRRVIAIRREGTIHLETCVIANEQWSGMVRPRFFQGRLLTADDLNVEQEYHREKHRRHLQTLHGSGIVEGLQVDVATDGVTITLSPGVAIDAYGREIFVNDTITLTVPSGSTSPVCVVVQYAERLIEPVVVPRDTETADSRLEPSRVEEGCQTLLSPEPCESGIVVARLIRQDDAWRVDPSFVPARLRKSDEHS